MWQKIGRGHTKTMSGTEWKSERQILTASEVDDEGFNSGGSIELRIDRFSEFVRDRKWRYSDPVYIRGLPLKISALFFEESKSNKQNGQSPFKDLAVRLSCDGACKTWKCQATISLRVVAQTEDIDGIIWQDVMAYSNYSLNFWGLWRLATCDMLLDQLNGFVKDDTIILQAHIQPLSIKIMSRIHAMKNTSLFSSSTKYPWDFVLMIQGKEVHVQKNYLAMHSEFFKDQFAKHEGDNRAVLKDVHYEDFIELLTVIYPSLCPITAENVETITILAFKFFMADLLKRCEAFLMENIGKFERAKTLLISEWYGLADLQETIIEQIKSITDIKAMKPEYDSLSDRSKRMLFDKICPPGSGANLVSELDGSSFTADRATEILKALESSAHCPPSGVLVVENNRIPIHKEHLAIYSKFFKQMFQGDFAERNMEEFVLEEVDYSEILELLMVIYPTQQQLSVTEKNVGVILKMADRFIMPAILERCEMLLSNSTQITAARKLLLAQRYNLPDLQVEYAKKYKTMSDVEELRAEPEFELLDDKTRVLILDSIIS